jgi:hypothetical protein
LTAHTRHLTFNAQRYHWVCATPSSYILTQCQ